MTLPPDPNQPQVPSPESRPPSGYGPSGQVPDYGSPDQAPGYGPAPGFGQPGGFPAAPPPPQGSYSLSPIQLPPGVELASRGRRTGAFFLAIPLEIVTLIIGYFIWGGVLWGRGTSPALKVLKCRVVDEMSGQPVTFGKMFLRDFVTALLGAVCGIVTIVSWVMFLTSDRRQSLGDRMAHTLVVYDPNGVLG